MWHTSLIPGGALQAAGQPDLHSNSWGYIVRTCLQNFCCCCCCCCVIKKKIGTLRNHSLSCSACVVGRETPRIQGHLCYNRVQPELPFLNKEKESLEKQVTAHSGMTPGAEGLLGQPREAELGQLTFEDKAEVPGDGLGSSSEHSLTFEME